MRGSFSGSLLINDMMLYSNALNSKPVCMNERIARASDPAVDYRSRLGIGTDGFQFGDMYMTYLFSGVIV